MKAPAIPFAKKIITAVAALTLACSMAPLAWADEGSAATAAGIAAGNAAEPDGAEGSEGVAASDAQAAPEASAQSADAKAAGSGSAGGTTVSIQVYRSSFPIVKWDLNDDDFNLTKAAWAARPADADLPQRGTPGQPIEWTAPPGYAEPTRAGFEFAGWSTDKSASAGGFLSAEPKLSMPDGAPAGGEYTLYALWTPLEYSVIFDLAKNPDANGVDGVAETDASFALNWDSKDDVRTVTPLGGGRFRVDGFTMNGDDYDATTRTVRLPKPGRTGYDFLGWAEPDGQALAIDNAAKDGYAMNPVRLTQIDGTPVLTARWSATFGVDVPLSVTFGDYDRTGAPGNPSLGESSSSAASDTTQSEADDVETEGLNDQDRYEAAGQACLKNTSWHEAVKVVGMRSERSPDASQVLVSYDTAKATNEEVLGGTDKAGVEHPGERLLSIYPSATVPADKSSGIHLRLSDQAGEDALGDAFSMGARGTDAATKDVSYGLNLSTDPVDGSDNHGLVLETQDYERKQIATVSYTFATADAATSEPVRVNPTGSTADSLYVTVDEAFISANGLSDKASAGTYGLIDIKTAAADLSASSSDPARSAYWSLYKALLDKQVMNNGMPVDSSAPYFQLKVDGVYLPLQLIGICQDTKTAGGKAGFTFQMRDIYAYKGARSADAGGGPLTSYMNSTTTNSGGWGSAAMRSTLRSTFWSYLPASVQNAITPVDKFQQLPSGATAAYLLRTTSETIWLPSMYEVFGTKFSGYNESEALAVNGNIPFQYMAYQGSAGSDTNMKALKTYNGARCGWWLRSAYRSNTYYFCTANSSGIRDYHGADDNYGAAPCFCL